MVMSEQHADTLRELVNIGFGRAASSLSELTTHQVILSVPSVSLVELPELGASFQRLIPGQVAAVQQSFSGGFDGDALLVLDHTAAAALADLMTETHPRPHGLDESDAEVLSEIGNILLNAFLGGFGNLLKAHLKISVPSMHLEKMDDLMQSLAVDSTTHALVISTTFRLREAVIEGYVVMVFSVRSLNKLLASLEALG